jgi:putative membrane protein
LMRHGGWNMMMGQGWLLCLLLAIIIGLVIYVILKLAGSGSQHRYQEKRRDTDKAMEILNQKLASGEISEDEYKRKKDLLLH